jgi:hypothetical protein
LIPRGLPLVFNSFPTRSSGSTSNPAISLAAQLQEDGAKSFVKSWKDAMAVIAGKSATLRTIGAG